uniref:Exopolygalacturonase n=1 Tax=Ananas comosus var. bracteatus TaxID=296719 RepID=A0A6V7PK81_ANACO|nr:unnamed protein product [Ananas comosus var. bracteatus]
MPVFSDACQQAAVADLRGSSTASRSAAAAFSVSATSSDSEPDDDDGVPRSDHLCSLLLLALAANSQDSSLQFNVKDFGAVADGVTDSTQRRGMRRARQRETEPCDPGGCLRGRPLMFKGPCKGFLVVQLRGQLLASTNLDAYSKNWIEFQYITGLLVSGGGRLDGRGALAWPHNDCPKQSHCSSCLCWTQSLVFSFVTDATVSGISSVDSKFFHMNIFSSSNVALDSIKISAPATAKHGRHPHWRLDRRPHNKLRHRHRGRLRVGRPGSVNVTISNVFCGPGHGISVGSLGKYRARRTSSASPSGTALSPAQRTGSE